MTSLASSMSDMKETAKQSVGDESSSPGEKRSALDFLVRDGKWMATPGTSEWRTATMT